MKVGSTDIVHFTIDGVDLLAMHLQALSFKISVRLEKTDGIGDAWDAHTPTGRRALTVTQAGGYFTADVDGAHGLLIGWPPGPHRLELMFAGNEVGAPVLVAEGTLVASYEVLARNGELTRANATYVISGAATFGTVAVPPAAAA